LDWIVKILVSGASGMLGQQLVRLASRTHQVWGTYLNHQAGISGCQMIRLDLTDAHQCQSELKSIKPEVIIHAAAMTDVDGCEREQDKARCINVDGTGHLAKAAEEIGARFVYISTDYVFDGEKGYYREEDAPAPINFYGLTKLLGEDQVRRHCTRGLILRTTIYGLKTPPTLGLIETLIKILREGKTLARFADQFATPLYTGQLSELTLKLLELGAQGLFHVGSADRISRFDFTRKLAEIFNFDGAAIRPVPFDPSVALARRPRDSSLICESVQSRFGVLIPTLGDGLSRLKEDWKSMGSERVAPQ
jgi:dTDP-4-dehydrorhamnose reductase